MKVKAFVYASYSNYEKKFRFETWPNKGDVWGTFICEQDIEVPAVDEAELIKGQVKFMQLQQQKIRAEAEVKYQNIEQQIQEMLCLEDKSK